MRLFIASGFPAPFLERVNGIQAFAASRLGRAVKWVEPENIHLTYAFLGSWPEDRVPAIERCIGAAAGLFKKPAVSLAGLGAFPSLERPRVLWLGLKEREPGTLDALALKLYEAIVAEGFILEHKFSAHITIGRVKARLPQAPLEEVRAMAAAAAGECAISSVELVESELSGSGPRYRTLASRELL